MRPLHAAAAGVALIVFDFRTTSLDLLPDVAGWLLLALAVHALCGWAWAALPIAGAVLSLSTLALPYHWIQIDPFTGETVVVDDDTDLGYAELLEYDDLTGGRLAMAAGATASAAAVMWLVAAVVARRAVDRGSPASARALRGTAAATVALWAAPRLVAMAAGALGDGYDPVWNDWAARIGMVGMLAGLAFAVVLAREAREPWSLRPGAERTLPSMRPGRTPA